MRQRPSQRSTNVTYYWRNRLREIQRVTARQALTVAMLRDLRSGPCADCGTVFKPNQMDFDHRDPALKRFGVTRMVGRAGTASMLAEAAWCDIVCANCHRSRTLIRQVRLSERE